MFKKLIQKKQIKKQINSELQALQQQRNTAITALQGLAK